MSTIHRSIADANDDVPAGVTDWCIWKEVRRGWIYGEDVPSAPGFTRGNAPQRVVRYSGPDGNGGVVLAELQIEHPAPDCWELWLVTVDSEGDETGYQEPLAWCRWPNTTLAKVCCFLIRQHKKAFQRGRTETDLVAHDILREFVPNTGKLMVADPESADDV